MGAPLLLSLMFSSFHSLFRLLQPQELIHLSLVRRLLRRRGLRIGRRLLRRLLRLLLREPLLLRIDPRDRLKSPLKLL